MSQVRPTALAAGARLGHYEIVGPLGAGAMGEVYRARDARLGREVALKVLPADVCADAERLARFEREARVVAGLNHPNIVTLHSVEDAGGTRFLTMELVEGRTLDRLVTPGGLPIAELLELGIALADALAAAHEHGVIHRDLKPANVMLTHDGRVKVLDFGLARLTAPVSELDATRTVAVAPSASSAGLVVGTVPYMSPEQLRGARVDARSDLFSLGVLLYELATGRRPFGGENQAETISAILRDPPRPLTDLRHDAPRQLARILEHSLQKDPDARFQTAKDVRNELRALRREVESGPLGTPADAGPPRSPRRPWRFGVTLTAIALLATIAGLWWRGRAPGPGGGSDPPGVVATPKHSLAVLPFANLSGEPQQEYFSDGLTEELLNVLAKIPDLEVTGRTSSFSFKGKHEDLRVIGQKLGVAHLLEGSVRKSGDRIRVTAQLVKADDGFHLWSETYDRTLDDILDVQDDIARQVAAALQVTLLGRDTAAAKPASVVYDLVLQARFALQSRTEQGVRRAKALLEQALARSPDHAPAWAELGLAHTRELELGTTVEARRVAGARGRAALEKALELDPDLALAHSRLANILMSAWEFAAAESAAARAMAADPRDPIVLGNTALLYSTLGRSDEAIALQERALAGDPLNLGRLANLANAYLLAGRTNDAEALARKRLALAPDEPFSHFVLGDIHLVRRETEAARRAYAKYVELSGQGDYGRLFFEAVVEHTAGNAEASSAAAAAFEKRFGAADPRGVAQLRAWRGEPDAAFAWLDRALAAREPGMAELRSDLYLRSLHADPRWNELLRKVGLPAE